MGAAPSGETRGVPRSQQQGPVAHLVKLAVDPGAPEGHEPHGWGQGMLSSQPQPLLCRVTLGSSPSMSAIKCRLHKQWWG